MLKKEEKMLIIGFICAKGYFAHYHVNRKRNHKETYKYPEWIFLVRTNKKDIFLLQMLKNTLKTGNICIKTNKKGEDNCIFSVNSKKANAEIVVPFFDGCLFGQKKEQFEAWEKGLLDYQKRVKKTCK